MFLVVLIAFLCFNSSVLTAHVKNPPIQVSNFELPAYMGRWYQMYASKGPLNTFEYGAACAVQDHSRFDGPNYDEIATFGVQISYNSFNPSGKHHTLQGFATNTEYTTSPTKFTLHLDDDIDTTHWVLAVGDLQYNPPLNAGIDPGVQHGQAPGKPKEGEYPWAIVSDMTSSLLYILARDIHEFSDKYQQVVLEKVQGMGFNTENNQPIRILQSSECNYPEVPPI